MMIVQRSATVLLAEDHDAAMVKDSLERKLSRHIAQIRIDCVETIESGRQAVAGYQEMPFCAILDYKLPEEHLGQAAKGDRSLCLLLRDRWRGQRQPFIIHVSSYSNQEDLRRHIEEAHRGHFDQKTAIAKDEKCEWIEWVANSIVQRYFEELLSDAIARVLPQEANAAGLDGTFSRESAVAGSITMPLVDLTLEVGLRWPLLSDAFKDKLRKIFDVDETVAPAAVDMKRPSDISTSAEGL